MGETTMNISRLDITREKSRLEDRSRNDETSFMRPATPLKTSQIGYNVSQMSMGSRRYEGGGKYAGGERAADNTKNILPKVDLRQELEYAFQSRPRIVNDFS